MSARRSATFDASDVARLKTVDGELAAHEKPEDFDRFGRNGRTDQGASDAFGRFSRFSRTESWPDPPASEAFNGPAGLLVEELEPHSEADPVALLLNFLVFCGSAVGRGPGFMAEGDYHGTNLNAVIVGPTSKGRKGTTHGRMRQVFEQIDRAWVANCMTSGLSSGEGLIWQVRDPITHRRKARKADVEEADADGYVTEIIDHGIEDKRLLVVEPEFSQCLRVMRREGNTLSAVVRNLWDHGTQRALTKNSPARTTNAHVSIVGHISRDELRRELTATDAASGFANRFLFTCARRSKMLPDGGTLRDEQLASIGRTLASVLAHARTIGVMQRDEHARELWHDVYPTLSEGRPGLLGAATARAEAQAMRLAVIYALLDGSAHVRVEHLKAALALWDYCERSAAHVFGDSLGDPVADEILEALRAAPEGLTRTQIRDLFRRHKSEGRIGLALGELADAGLAESVKRATGGRPVEIWRACAKSDLCDERSGGMKSRGYRRPGEVSAP